MRWLQNERRSLFKDSFQLHLLLQSQDHMIIMSDELGRMCKVTAMAWRIQDGFETYTYTRVEERSTKQNNIALNWELQGSTTF
jgi:hypothetical protein